MNICVVGTGYVGLVTGAVFADLGNDVICVDNVKEKIDMLNSGIMPIYEPGLKELVNHNMEDGRLIFSTDLNDGVMRSEVIFIAVGTPPKENGETDLSHVQHVARGIARSIERYKIIVNKSTVPVGTGDMVREIIERNKRRDVDFDVVSNPEFLREGSAIRDTLYPDRIIIGAPSQHVAMTLLELYASLERPMLITDVHSAEMIKYASNSFLAMKISFINAIANICEKAGADVTQVVKGMGYDKRIGSNFMNPGLGFGGSCFPKDVDSLIHIARKFGTKATLFESIVEINKYRAQHFINLIKEKMDPMAGKQFGILGLAFKPNTDDIREAKSLEIIKLLLAEKAIIKAYDPAAMENCKKIFPDIEYCKSSYDAAEGSDALLIVTEWNEFKLLNMEKIIAVMKKPVIFDGRNIYRPERKKRLGFEYYSIGR
ncbi:UDP-glucose dehydrogenase family protein [candidate division CSSED10-310 bacterium]|uniref:UDP-glucose 6-dehydrogenase n=1 Tax=candidate division CSSED10-310 bacterium TaxID=2855610 RepID=A0ABV6YW89_UNCC1